MSRDVAIITGASRGIGFATAARFLRGGWRVINVSRHAAQIEGVLDILTDLSSPAALAQIGGEVESALSAMFSSDTTNFRLCLVHNAAALERDSSLCMQVEQLRRVLEINIVAPIILNSALSPLMSSGSSIIYMGSTLSEKAVAQRASYVLSKHAVAGLMRATCQDAQDGRLHTVCVCPGFVDTDMLGAGSMSDDVRREIESRTAFKRLIRPDEIADIVWTAAITPALNGAVIHANLGQFES